MFDLPQCSTPEASAPACTVASHDATLVDDADIVALFTNDDAMSVGHQIAPGLDAAHTTRNL
jgi:hypothetical protein